MQNRIELRNKIFLGVKKAVEKLIASRAKENDFIIVSRNGKIEKIPAKEIQQN